MRLQLKKILAPLEKYQILETGWLWLKYRRARRSEKSLPSLSFILLKAVALFTNRLKIVRRDNSFAGEHLTLAKTLTELDIQEGYLVDIGAADGIRQSSTVGFLSQSKWEGTLFEYSADSFSRLAFLYNDSQKVNLAKVKVTPLNVVALFKGFEIPQNFEYLNIDIDSYDLSVLRVLIDSGFRPKIISMEVNEKFPPNIYFEVLYTTEHSWTGDHFFGCSLTAAYENLYLRGYELVKMEYNNAIFKENRVPSQSSQKADLVEIYRNGYLLKEDREELFPWNKDFEFIQEMESKHIIEFLNRAFHSYSGKYKLEIR